MSAPAVGALTLSGPIPTTNDVLASACNTDRLMTIVRLLAHEDARLKTGNRVDVEWIPHKLQATRRNYANA